MSLHDISLTCYFVAIAISSLGETHLEELSSTTGPSISLEVIPEPPIQSDTGTDSDAAGQISQEGEIGDDVIEDIIGQEDSSGEEEGGMLPHACSN